MAPKNFYMTEKQKDLKILRLKYTPMKKKMHSEEKLYQTKQKQGIKKFNKSLKEIEYKEKGRIS